MAWLLRWTTLPQPRRALYTQKYTIARWIQRNRWPTKQPFTNIVLWLWVVDNERGALKRQVGAKTEQ
eukprot:scaffold3576_cov170-Amphora_coffeaeformis.AAC.27